MYYHRPASDGTLEGMDTRLHNVYVTKQSSTGASFIYHPILLFTRFLLHIVSVCLLIEHMKMKNNKHFLSW